MTPEEVPFGLRLNDGMETAVQRSGGVSAMIVEVAQARPHRMEVHKPGCTENHLESGTSYRVIWCGLQALLPCKSSIRHSHVQPGLRL